MGATRILIEIDSSEREHFQAAADRAGVSLSVWLREAAREKLQGQPQRDMAWLNGFFDACAADQGVADSEPGIDQLRELIEGRYDPTARR